MTSDMITPLIEREIARCKGKPDARAWRSIAAEYRSLREQGSAGEATLEIMRYANSAPAEIRLTLMLMTLAAKKELERPDKGGAAAEAGTTGKAVTEKWGPKRKAETK